MIFSEDFSGGTPGPAYEIGAIPGTKFAVTSANVDIVGVLNGNYFTPVANPNGNALDLIGNRGSGAIASIPTFSLSTGMKYTISFQYILQGFDPGSGATSNFTVGLGAFSDMLTAIPQVETASLMYTPTANQSGAVLSFATNTAPSGINGAVLSDIVVTAVAAVPEPSSIAMVGLGLAGVGAFTWRKSRGNRWAAPVAARPSILS